MSDTDPTTQPQDDAQFRDALETLILTAVIAKDARHDTEQRLKRFGAEFTAPQYRVLRQLQHVERSTIKELSRSMMLEPATLVPMVDSLERHGLIRRGSDPSDRRRTPLELTDAGREQLSRVPYIHEDDPIARYLGGLSVDERREFLRVLRGLATALHSDHHRIPYITDAVNAYFDFGRAATEQQHAQSRPVRRRARPPHKEGEPSP